MNSHDDFAFEPIPGLPEHLPEGESILWQGKPGWFGIASRVLHTKLVAIYCAIMLGWFALNGIYVGHSGFEVLQSLGIPLILVAALFAILVGVAYGLARSTIYTITNRRLVLRFGIALPITINLPFAKIETAALRKHSDGSGDITLAIRGKDHLAWLHLWPNVRPWHLRKPEPMLRSLPDADDVAVLLADAMAKELPAGLATPPQPKQPQGNPAGQAGLATA